MKILTEVNYALSTIEFVKAYVGKSFLITDSYNKKTYIGVLCGYYDDEEIYTSSLKIDFLLFGFEKKEEYNFWMIKSANFHKVFIKKKYYYYFQEYSKLKLL